MSNFSFSFFPIFWLLLLPPFLLQPAERRRANEGICSAEVVVAVLLPEVELPFRWIWGWVGHLFLDYGCTSSVCCREACFQDPLKMSAMVHVPTGMLILSWRTNSPAAAAAQTCTKPPPSLLLLQSVTEFHLWGFFLTSYNKDLASLLQHKHMWISVVPAWLVCVCQSWLDRVVIKLSK